MADGTKAGAQAWWLTIAPGGKVPTPWTQGVGDHVAGSSDGAYMFAGHSNADGSGFGDISWTESQPPPPKSASLHVVWGTDGLYSGELGSHDPTSPDPGQVTPVQPFGNLSWATGLGAFLSALMDKSLWVRIGEGAAAVLILLIGFYLVLHKEGVVSALPIPA